MSVNGRVESKTEAELRQLARDYVEGRIFTNRNCPGEMLLSVFLVAALGGLADSITFLKENPESNERIGLIYEYISEAGPRSVNGYPSFMSLKLLNFTDATKIADYMEEYEKLQAGFTKTA